MSNVVKTAPIGLDARVQSLQTSLYTYLKSEWGLTDTNFTSYGLCYRNRRESGYVPEVFTGGKDYAPVTHDDKLAVKSFFGVGENIKSTSIQQTAEVHYILFVNLEKITTLTATALGHRGENEAKLKVYEYLCRQTYGFELLGQVTGIEKVLSEYPGLKGNLISVADKHPWHAFRFNLKCTYHPYEEA